MYFKIITAIQGCEKGNIEQSLGKWKKKYFSIYEKNFIPKCGYRARGYVQNVESHRKKIPIWPI